jgi:hypothetical protein
MRLTRLRQGQQLCGLSPPVALKGGGVGSGAVHAATALHTHTHAQAGRQAEGGRGASSEDAGGKQAEGRRTAGPLLAAAAVAVLHRSALDSSDGAQGCEGQDRQATATGRQVGRQAAQAGRCAPA